MRQLLNITRLNQRTLMQREPRMPQKAEADKAVGDAMSAKERTEVAAAEARYQETVRRSCCSTEEQKRKPEITSEKAQTDYQAARGEFDSAVKDANDYGLSQSVSDLTQTV